MDFKIQWFPGHMTKAKRMMEQQLKLVDVVVEMLDARIPRSSSNPMLIQMLGDKPKVVALNKIDMADPEKTEKWLQTFKNSGLPVCKVDCSTGKGVKQMVAAIQQVARPVTDKWLRKGVRNRSIRVMIVGVPNVGKSTLINRLVGKNKVVAADRPGVTRGQQWVTIAKGLELLDTPGVLWPKFEDPEVGFCLAVTGAIKEDVYDRETAVELLLERLMHIYPEDLRVKYAIDFSEAEPVREVMSKIAVARGCLKAGGVLDIDKVIQHQQVDGFPLPVPDDPQLGIPQGHVVVEALEVFAFGLRLALGALQFDAEADDVDQRRKPLVIFTRPYPGPVHDVDAGIPPDLVPREERHGDQRLDVLHGQHFALAESLVGQFVERRDDYGLAVGDALRPPGHLVHRNAAYQLLLPGDVLGRDFVGAII